MTASAEYEALQREDARYRESHSLKCVGGGATAPCCPLCPDVHPICRFEPRTLTCVVPDCGNPHHREV